jgi:RHS repeat-associated protein
VTQFLYDGLNPVQELNGTPSVTANLLTGLSIDEYLTRADSSGTVSFLPDALGSTIGLVGTGGTIGTSYTYQPFGATTVVGSNANSYQFTGRENDSTRLYFYRARYYSPTFQRFIAQDPLKLVTNDIDLYGYVDQAPSYGTDPLGLWTFQVGGGFTWSAGPLNISLSVGFVIDGHGNTGIITTYTGPLGTIKSGGSGILTSSVSGGLQFGASTAETICDLTGPFNTFGVSGGTGELGGSVDVYQGSSPHGDVIGGNVTIGSGAGLSGYGPVSVSTVTPFQLPEWVITF